MQILQANIKTFQQKSEKYCSDFYIGSELEFYVFSSLSPLISASQEQLQIFLANIPNCKTEQGLGQLEIVFIHTNNFLDLINNIEQTKKNIYSLATQNNLWVSFAGKPLKNDCGSALQFSLSWLPKQQNNENFIESFYIPMAVALLEKTKENLAILNLFTSDYLRYCIKANRSLFLQHKNTSPVNLSFGYNNRSCAIRITRAENIGGKNIKRLEYRVASASASPSLVLNFIISTLNFGLEKYFISPATKHNSQGFGPIFGNAFDEQYELETMVSSWELAVLIQDV